MEDCLSRGKMGGVLEETELWRETKHVRASLYSSHRLTALKNLFEIGLGERPYLHVCCFLRLGVNSTFNTVTRSVRLV